MPDRTPNCHPLAEKAKCNCGSPDGVGTHLVGCHVYDTPLMEQLRYDHHICQDEYSEAVGDFFRATHFGRGMSAVSDLKDDLNAKQRALNIVCAKIAVEDEKNPNGIHDDEPWKGMHE